MLLIIFIIRVGAKLELTISKNGHDHRLYLVL